MNASLIETSRLIGSSETFSAARDDSEFAGQTAAVSGSPKPVSRRTAERERERLHTGIEELDLELSLGDRSRLSHQLIQALLGNGHRHGRGEAIKVMIEF